MRFNKFSMIIGIMIISLTLLNFSHTLENGLALTPPMGWMSWERYRCIVDCAIYPDDCLNENLIMQTADLLKSEGYKDIGYTYVILGDCWMSKLRDKDGNIQADKERFPSGMKALADYIHSRGLKFGLYENVGELTCAGYPGVKKHIKEDVQQFVAWEVDYIKLDGCLMDLTKIEQAFIEFGRHLNESGRPVVYSCGWPAYTEAAGIPADYRNVSEICNLWRNWGDINDDWHNVTNVVDFYAENQDRLIPYAGPGQWNDPDSLIIGDFGLSLTQSQSQMAIWAILAAPLIMSNDLRNIRPEFKEILQNKEIIAVNQDPLGMQGRRLTKKREIEVWIRPVTPVLHDVHYSYAIAVLNRRIDGRPYYVNINLENLGLSNLKGYAIKDLYNPNIYEQNSTYYAFNTRVPPTGVTFILATPIN